MWEEDSKVVIMSITNNSAWTHSPSSTVKVDKQNFEIQNVGELAKSDPYIYNIALTELKSDNNPNKQAQNEN